MKPKGNSSDRVDDYIARAPEFARPLLAAIRIAFHSGCPGLSEEIKWGVPYFMHHGMLGGMAAFKRHVAFGFWKSRLLSDPAGLFRKGPKASMCNVRIESAEDLPPRKVLVSYVREAARLNESGVRNPPAAGKTRMPATPPDLARLLRADAVAGKVFASFPPSHRREYIEWIEEAKRAETRQKRLAQTLLWLREGKSRNWKYQSGSRSAGDSPPPKPGGPRKTGNARRSGGAAGKPAASPRRNRTG